MSESNDNHEPTTTDELHDRLLDRALTEVIGGESPPDLSERITTAAVTLRPGNNDIAESKSRFARFSWIHFAVAASLLVGAATLLWPRVHETRMYGRASKASAKPDLSGFVPGQQQTEGVRFESLSAVESTRISVGSEWGYARPAEKSDRYAKEISQLSVPRIIITDESQPAAVLWEELASRRKKYATIDKLPQDGERTVLGTDSYAVQGLVREHTRGRSAPVNGREHLLRENSSFFFRGEAAAGFAPAGRPKQLETDLGIGPGFSGDQYTRIHENPFIEATGGDAVSTFSIDVDTASYANVRQFLMEMHQLPPPDAVRIEELVNYFPYDYAGPTGRSRLSDEDAAPFAAHVEVAGCTWKPEHRLVRIGIKGRQIERERRPTSNLVFLVDVSGSMQQTNKLPLVVHGLKQLARELGENDRVAIVVYASREGVVLPSTPGSEQQTILAALGQLRAGGSTAGGAGIRLAYQIAEDHFITGGTNRVILCTDGDFNVGVTSTAELERLVEEKAKQTGVFLSVLGFGRGNLNDAMMEAISGRGNGNYYYVDNRREARKVLVEEMTGTLVTIAKDVKIQVEFNPAQVTGYRLIGYENRMLRTEDFNDDTKDAGEIGAGHAVTALYEVIPAGQPVDLPPVDELKYQRPAGWLGSSDSEPPASTPAGGSAEPRPQPPHSAIAADTSGELLTLKMRYKRPDGDVSRKLEWAVSDTGKSFSAATTDFQFASSVAGFGLLLRDSQYKAGATWDAVLEIAESSRGSDEHGYRTEFLELVRRAKALQPER